MSALIGLALGVVCLLIGYFLILAGVILRKETDHVRAAALLDVLGTAIVIVVVALAVDAL